jgi:uncharacterized protein YjbI with pentapeptide repeats
MADDHHLEQRVAALEQAAAQRSRADRWLRGLLAIALVLGLGGAAWLLRSAPPGSVDETARQFWLLCHPGATEEMRVTAFLHLVEEDNTEWQSARLARLPLEGADLAGVDLQKARLESSRLQRAVLSGANLQYSLFQTAELADALLDNVSADGASFLKADLSRANLSNIKLRGGSLQQATLAGAKVSMADLSDADLRMADFTGADLGGANLAGADLTSAVLKQATLSLANLAGAGLANVDFTDSDWWNTRGLQTEQLELLATVFPPSDQAPEALREDFQQWLKSR